MPAGFLIKRLLLVCLLSDVGYKSLATAQQLTQTEWQNAQRPADYMISPYAHQMQSQDAQGNPWVKLVEGLVRNQGYRQNQQPHSQYLQQPHSPYPKQGLKYPTAVLASQPHPAVEPKKIEFNMNIPLQYILRGIAQSKKGPEWLRNMHDGADSAQIALPHPEEVGGLTRTDRKNVMAPIKRKGPSDPFSSGLHIKLTAPIKSLRDKSMTGQRLGANDQEPVQIGLPEIGPEWHVLRQSLGAHQGLLQNPQHQAQLQPHLSLFRHLLYPQRLHDPSSGHDPLKGLQSPTQVLHNPSQGLQNPTPLNQNPSPVLHKPFLELQIPTPLNQNPPQAERAPSEIRGFQTNPDHQTKQVLVVDQILPPDGSMANPRFGPRASRWQTAPNRWILCPQYFVR